MENANLTRIKQMKPIKRKGMSKSLNTSENTSGHLSSQMVSRMLFGCFLLCLNDFSFFVSIDIVLVCRVK